MSHKAVWLVSIPTIIGDEDCPPNHVDNVHNNVLDHYELAINAWSTKNKLADRYFQRYGPLPSHSPDGSIGQMFNIADNMVMLAHSFYMSICTNLSWIDQVHIVSSRSGAILAVKFISFIKVWGTSLYDVPLKTFDSEWNRFVVGESQDVRHMPGHKNLVDLFQSLVVIDPSLPTPGFLARWIVPLNFYRHTVTLPELGTRVLQVTTCDLPSVAFGVEVLGQINNCKISQSKTENGPPAYTDILFHHLQGLHIFSKP